MFEFDLKMRPQNIDEIFQVNCEKQHEVNGIC
jgi:hypothetical protein